MQGLMECNSLCFSDMNCQMFQWNETSLNCTKAFIFNLCNGGKGNQSTSQSNLTNVFIKSEALYQKCGESKCFNVKEGH